MPNIFKQLNKKLDQEASPLPAPARPADYHAYSDPTGEFGTKEFTRALWYVRHKALLYRLGVAALLLCVALSWGYSLWRFGDYIIFGIDDDRRLSAGAAQFFDYSSLHARYGAEPLQLVSTRILPGGVQKYDVLAEVSNPNSRFLVQFDYHFLVDGSPTPRQRGFLLPSETKPLPYFGLERPSSPGSATLVLENFAWRRVSNKTVPDTDAYQNERIQFAVSDFRFTRSDAIATTTASTHIVQFVLKNNSSYGYREPQFYAALTTGGLLAQIIPFSVANFASRGSRLVDLRSFVPNLQVTDVRVFPVLNIYDPAAYLSPPS